MSDFASPQNPEVKDLVHTSQRWLEHINDPDTQLCQRLFTTESHWRGLWEMSGHSILLVDDNLNIIDANPHLCYKMHTNLAQITSKKLSDIIPDVRFDLDYINIKTLIDGDGSNAHFDTALNTRIGGSLSTPVHIIACRVPHSPQADFRFMIVHIYELPQFETKPQDLVKDMTWGDILKHCVVKHPVATSATIIALLFLIIIACQGNFADVLLHLLQSA